MLVLLQEEEINNGAGVGGYIGLQNRFAERWGTAPACDPVGFLNTAYRLSLINRDLTVQLTTKGSRLLGSMHRLLDDWYAFHMKSDLEQLLFQSEREVELMDAYEAKGYETRSLARALGFLERAYKDIRLRTSPRGATKGSNLRSRYSRELKAPRLARFLPHLMQWLGCYPTRQEEPYQR
jgi:hypothetical protein